MTAAERAVLACSQARALCLSLHRAFAGPRALARLHDGDVGTLTPAELRLAVGLAWATGEHALARRTLVTLGPERVGGDPILAALAEAVERTTERASSSGDAATGPPRGA